MDLHFSDHFGVDQQVLDDYGAFDVSVVSDLPMFIDPFLLFNSERAEYQELHERIIRYLVFLRDKSATDLDPGLIDNLYRFQEVRQNWLGFTVLGNGGSGLGRKFARSLNASLHSILQGFGQETVTQSSHLEKLCLIQSGVGKDNISDFTTNLIKDYLCEYTATFAEQHLAEDQCHEFPVKRARFNYTTESWETVRYTLPALGDDFILLSPIDMLTRDETWINHSDMLRQFHRIPDAIPDHELRAQVNQYFGKRLGDKPTQQERQDAAASTINQFPALIDFYIRLKEDDGDRATQRSARLVDETDQIFVDQLRALLADLDARTTFNDAFPTSYDEALARATHFKHYVENQDGYRLINRAGQPFSKENEVQLFFGLVWYRTAFDVNREPNNGRGPVDFKVSKGSIDKSLIEFKLASNSRLKRNLEKQVEIYEKANQTRTSVKVIVCYTEKDQDRVARILKELKLDKEPSIVVIDARSDNKPSASKA